MKHISESRVPKEHRRRNLPSLCIHTLAWHTPDTLSGARIVSSRTLITVYWIVSGAGKSTGLMPTMLIGICRLCRALLLCM